MKVTVSKTVGFEAAHFLPDYVGKCANLHGHHWKVEVGITGSVNPETGMVVDFSTLKAGLKPILDNLDHGLVNTIVKMPTAENIGLYIFNWLDTYWIPSLLEEEISIEYVKVGETEDSCAEVRSE